LTGWNAGEAPTSAHFTRYRAKMTRDVGGRRKVYHSGTRKVHHPLAVF